MPYWFLTIYLYIVGGLVTMKGWELVDEKYEWGYLDWVGGLWIMATWPMSIVPMLYLLMAWYLGYAERRGPDAGRYSR